MIGFRLATLIDLSEAGEGAGGRQSRVGRLEGHDGVRFLVGRLAEPEEGEGDAEPVAPLPLLNPLSLYSSLHSPSFLQPSIDKPLHENRVHLLSHGTHGRSFSRKPDSWTLNLFEDKS